MQHLLDPHLERLAGTGASDLDRADESVPRVERVALAPALREGLTRRVAPARVQARERDRVTGLDGENRLEVPREVTVQRASLERDLVQRHAARTRRAASATRATDGMYASSICQ